MILTSNMASWKHTEIIIDGQPVKAQAPIMTIARIWYRL